MLYQFKKAEQKIACIELPHTSVLYIVRSFIVWSFIVKAVRSFVYMSGREKEVAYRRELYYCYCDNYERREIFKRGVILNENKLEGMNSF